MKTIEESVAAAMDGTTPEIFPFLPYILQDFWEIGTAAEEVISILEKNSPGKDITRFNILDLGCGKGVVSIKLAARFGCSCMGIDGIPAFIEDAREKAKEFKVDKQCVFKAGDIRKEIDLLDTFDVIVLGAIGPVFGNYFETLSRMKAHLSPGGMVIIDDGYLDDESGKNHHTSILRSELLSQTADAGMELVDEKISEADEDIIEEFDEQYTFIERRCKELMEQYPEKEGLFKDYLANQKNEYNALENDLVCSLMVFRKK